MAPSCWAICCSSIGMTTAADCTRDWAWFTSDMLETPPSRRSCISCRDCQREPRVDRARSSSASSSRSWK